MGRHQEHGRAIVGAREVSEELPVRRPAWAGLAAGSAGSQNGPSARHGLDHDVHAAIPGLTEGQEVGTGGPVDVGFLPDVERILAKWRRRPLSIKFTLPDETSEYAQSLYIDGQNKNRIKVLPRRGLLGLPPTVGDFPDSWSILFHKAKNPITDFGPQRMLERTLFKIRLAQERNIPGQIFEYKGVVKLQITGQVAHHIDITNPVHPSFPHSRQDLYIDAELQIPAGSYVWNREGVLDAMYLYADMNLDPSLTDADFTIEPPSSSRPAGKARPASRPAKGTKP